MSWRGWIPASNPHSTGVTDVIKMTKEKKIMGAQIPIELYERIQRQRADRNMTKSDAVKLGLTLLDIAWGADNE